MSDQPIEAVVSTPAPAVADVTPSTPTHVQDAVKAESFADRMAKAKAVFAERAGGSQDTSNAPVDTSKEVEAVAEAKAKHEEAPSAKTEAAHARALAALRKAEAENLRLKHESKASSEKLSAELAADRAALKALQDQMKAFSKNPTAALKAAGMTAEDFMRGIVNGTIKPPAPDEALRDQVASKLTPLEQELATIKAELEERRALEAQREAEAKQTAARESDLGVVRNIVTEDEYPITVALGAFDAVLHACYESGSHDVAGKAAEFEAHQVSLLENLFNPKVIAALEKRSPKIRETVSALRGSQSRQASASSGSPRVPAARDMVSAPTTPVEQPKTHADRMARAKALLNGLQK